MKETVQPRDPEIRLYFPVWYHHHGSKMRVSHFNPQNHTLVIDGSAANLTINRAKQSYRKKEGWFIEWKVSQAKPSQEGTVGRVWFSDKDLAAAFGIIDETDKYSAWLIQRYGGDCATQGKYIRWKNFLNIPCPGTGHDGDPNVSIDLDDEIQNAVKQLLEQ